MRQIDGYGCEDVLPRGFVSLMDLYEGNFIKLRKLLSDCSRLQEESVSRIAGHMDLYLKIEERSKYTTTLRLSYCFVNAQGIALEPNLKIRIYHDAGLAEAVSGNLHHGRERLHHLPSHALRQKWRLNRFLHKWLGYLLRQGHSFEPFVMDSRHKIDAQLKAAAES